MSLGMVAVVPVNAQEPKRPAPTGIFDSKKEAKISEVKRLGLDQAFEKLKDMDFLVDEDLLNTAIFRSFQDQKKNAIAYSIQRLEQPRREIIDGKLVDRALDLYVAKKTLQMFPDESLYNLISMYLDADPPVRANIIFALGGMEGDPAIRNLLLTALDDDAFSQEEDPQMEGKPLRVCDEAYNQLVLRYQVKNVLRNIGNVHPIEDRNYHIQVLKSIL